MSHGRASPIGKAKRNKQIAPIWLGGSHDFKPALVGSLSLLIYEAGTYVCRNYERGKKYMDLKGSWVKTAIGVIVPPHLRIRVTADSGLSQLIPAVFKRNVPKRPTNFFYSGRICISLLDKIYG